MNHADHVGLIRGGVMGAGLAWADLGSGEGAFTLALADLLGPGGAIHSVDRDGGALEIQLERLAERFPGVAVTPIVADFTRAIDLPPLDGIVMANSLHFVRDKGPVLELVRGYLRPGGRFVLVEYAADRGNQWVPYPLSFATWSVVAGAAGFRQTRLLASVPSRFLESIYSAVSFTRDPGP
jgi:SAM-dependent methyltransferase